MKRLRVAVIGVGHVGEYHVQKYAALPEAELIGVVDIDRERARFIASRYDTKAYFSHEDILDQVDAVSIAVPTKDHFSIGLDVLSQGVHLLVEKPITDDVEQAQRLIKEAAARSLVLQVGHTERFNPAVRVMQTMVNGPIFVESHRLNPFTPRGTDVDVVLDLMIHDLDIILNLVGSPIKELHGVGMSVLTGKTDIANVRIIFEDGAVANLTASRVSNKTIRKLRIFQSDAYLSVDFAGKELGVTRLGQASLGPEGFPQIVTSKRQFPDSDPMLSQIRSFLTAVLEGRSPEVSGEDGKRALWVAKNIIGQIERGCKYFQTIC
ncbi:MAG: gfo/Idh/MocA family oxidoreductase [Deltaproteobacteria bacterium]|nr:MAG: gfo/Idh/MocA family oxidoreductase [Deltaproteobacteria bacterium]